MRQPEATVISVYRDIRKTKTGTFYNFISQNEYKEFCIVKCG